MVGGYRRGLRVSLRREFHRTLKSQVWAKTGDMGPVCRQEDGRASTNMASGSATGARARVADEVVDRGRPSPWTVEGGGERPGQPAEAYVPAATSPIRLFIIMTLLRLEGVMVK